MSDPTEAKLIPLSDVPNLPWIPARRGGARLNRSTVHRWASFGCNGVRLETLAVGGARCTSEPALVRFFERLAMPDATERTVTSSQNDKAKARANAILAAAGI